MTWLESILIGVLLAIAGTLFGGFLASLSIRWLRISQREGLAGYWMVFMGLVAGVFSLLCGLLIARYGGFDSFFLALAVAAAVALGGIGLAGLLTWASSDRAPRVDGKTLGFDLELRSPPGAKAIGSGPEALRGYISAHKAGMLRVEFDFGKLRQVDGRWLVPGQVPFQTRRIGPYIALSGERLNNATLFFYPDVSPPLRRKLGQWSPWMQMTSSSPLDPASDAAGFELRTRLRLDGQSAAT